MRLTVRIIALWLLAVQPLFADDLERLKAKLEEYREQYGFPGAVAAFVSSDGREGAAAVGFSDVEARVPLTIHDKLLSGSTGKTYVSAVALQLVGEKKLDLDAKISRWLGDEAWFSRLPNGKDITVRMLMNHTSGIKEHVYNSDFHDAVAEDPDRVWKPAEIIEFALDADPLFPAGEGWAYADTNYIVLGMILEKITGRPYYEELEKRVLKPLDLKDTVPSDRRAIKGLITGYAGDRSPFKKKGKTIEKGKLTVNPQVEWTGGGLACTTMDLARWTWAVYHGKAFPSDLLEQVLDGVPALTGKGDQYGLGVQIWKGEHGDCRGHGGWFPGYLTQMAYYPDLKLAVAIQFNSDREEGVIRNMRSFLDDLTGILNSKD